MAITRMAWMGYVLAHMVGNFKVYLGELELNHDLWRHWFVGALATADRTSHDRRALQTVRELATWMLYTCTS